MKVSVSDFELHLIPFMKRIADAMPSSLHKWLGGVIIATSAGKLEKIIGSQADKDGIVDLDALKKLVYSGFNASGGEVVIPFGSDTMNSFGIKTVNVKITKSDADEFFAGFSG